MSDCCCTPSSNHSLCPVDQSTGQEVSLTTIFHHIKKPWLFTPEGQHFFFCQSPDCEVVYFSDAGETITQSQLRTPVGIKAPGKEGLLCYCYGVTYQQALETPEIKAFVIQQTKQKQCACEARNPSGRCCLKDFP